MRGRSFWITRGGIAVHKQTPHPARFLVDTGHMAKGQKGLNMKKDEKSIKSIIKKR